MSQPGLQIYFNHTETLEGGGRWVASPGYWGLSTPSVDRLGVGVGLGNLFQRKAAAISPKPQNREPRLHPKSSFPPLESLSLECPPQISGRLQSFLPLGLSWSQSQQGEGSLSLSLLVSIPGPHCFQPATPSRALGGGVAVDADPASAGWLSQQKATDERGLLTVSGAEGH